MIVCTRFLPNRIESCRNLSSSNKEIQGMKGRPLYLIACSLYSFHTVMKVREPDYASRLNYLEQHTWERPWEIMCICFYVAPKEDYIKVRSLLDGRFGQKQKNHHSMPDASNKQSMHQSLRWGVSEVLSVLLSGCTNTPRSISYSSKVESPDVMQKIIKRLPSCLQDKWP